MIRKIVNGYKVYEGEKYIGYVIKSDSQPGSWIAIWLNGRSKPGPFKSTVIEHFGDKAWKEIQDC